jgi:RNA polymerase sigma-70 factor (ECF subfamily)
VRRPAARDPEPTVRSKGRAVGDLSQEFRALYDAWLDDVSLWVAALGGPDADRDDIIQEVFLVVRRRLAAFDGQNVAGWLYRITRRKVRDFRRRAWVRHFVARRHFCEPDDLPGASGTPAAALERKEDRRLLNAMLRSIPDDRRVCFVLFEIEGLSGEEIARVQGIPVNTVWTRLFHARRQFLAMAKKLQLRQRAAQAEGRIGDEWSWPTRRKKGNGDNE